MFRTARTLRQWIGGRELTAAQGSGLGSRARELVGRRVEAVEPRGKHLLLRLSDHSCSTRTCA